MEHRGGVRALHVLEEGGVDRPGRVVEGEEHDPAPGPDRGCLGGDLHPGDEDLGPAALPEQVGGPGHLDRVEERVVEPHDVPARVETEDLQLGTHPLGVVHLGQPADLAVDRRVAEVQRELDGGDRAGPSGRLRLPGGLLPDAGLRLGRVHPRPLVPRHLALRTLTALLARPLVVARLRVALLPADQVVGAVATRRVGGALDRRQPPTRRCTPGGQATATALAGPVDRPRMTVEVGHLQQQVAPGDLASTTHPRAAGAGRPDVDAVDRVEPAGEHQPLHDRPGHLGAVPEVGERLVGPGRHDAVHLGLGDPLQLRQGQPDSVDPARRHSTTNVFSLALTSRPSTMMPN